MLGVGERIQARADSLTDSQRELADFVMASYERAVFLTAAQLAQRVGCSESSAVRFAQSLGYEGYAEFRRALQDTLRDRLTTVERMAGLVQDTDNEGDIVDRVMGSDMASIDATLGNLSRDALYRVGDSLLSARRIAVVGLRGSAGLAHIFGFGLQWVLRNVSVITSGDAREDIIAVGPKDLVFAISFPRYTSATVGLLEFASERGALTVGLTDSVISPLAKYADILLLAHSGQVSYADSLCAPLSVINVLLAVVGQRGRIRVEGALSELEEMWARYGIYARPHNP